MQRKSSKIPTDEDRSSIGDHMEVRGRALIATIGQTRDEEVNWRRDGTTNLVELFGGVPLVESVKAFLFLFVFYSEKEEIDTIRLTLSRVIAGRSSDL